MASWRYVADGGVHTVEEDELRKLVDDGKLHGSTQIQEVGAERWTTVNESPFGGVLNRPYAQVPHQIVQAPTRTGRNWKPLIVVALLAVGGYGYYWYDNRITCSSPDVKRIATRLVKEKLLKLTSGDVNLLNIATLGSLDSGGAKCSADVEVTGGPDAGYRSVSYSAERQGDSIAVVGRMER